MSHYLGEGWSERNPIPTVQSYEREKREREGLDEPSAVSQFMDRWVYSSHDERDPGVPSETGPSSDDPSAGSHGNHGGMERSMHNQLGQVPDTHEHFLNAHDLESRNYSNQQPADESPNTMPALNGTPSYLQSGRVHHSGTTLDNSGAAPRIVVGGSASNGQLTTAGQAGAATSGGLQQRPSHQTMSQSDKDSYTGAQSLTSTSSAGLPTNQDQQKGQANVSSGGQRSDASEGGVENQRSNKNPVPGAGGGEEEKNRIKEQAAKSQRKTNNQFVAKGEREVDDPITGRGVIIHDGSKNFDIDPKRLDSRFEGGYSTERLKPDAVQDERYTSPDPVQPSSVLLQTFPEPPSMEILNQIKSSFNNVALWVAALLIVVWAMSAFGHGWSAFFFRTTMLSLVGVFIYGGLGLAYAKVQKSIEVVRASMHKQRGEKFCPPMPESAEWLNAIVACLWKQLNPEMFVSVLDMVEDIMQSSLPGFIQAVKISDFGLGENPVRMIAMRALADVMTDPEYPRKTWIEHSPGMDDGTEGEGEDSAQYAEGETGEELHRAKKQDEAGDFLNMEVSFCYSAISGETTKDRSKNVHMLVEFFLGAFDWVEIPLPVWVQIDHVMGTVRIRVQVTSEPPFLRNVTVSLMGVPSVSIRAIPMAKFLPNVLDLPLISNFVQSSIAAACNMYVAPKSMTLNLTDMLAGDGVKKDTDALGVLMVTIHYGVDLSSQDVNGKSDPYTVLSFAKFGRPLYATRIIFEDLNPVWEETAFLLVSRDDLRSGESLSLQLWDNDKRSADDIVGRVNVPLTDLIRKPNEIITKTTQLMGFEDADEMQGQLHWSAGFFEKSKLNKKLQKKHNEKSASQAEQESKREPSPIDTEEEARTLSTPPDPQWPSGILSVVVRHIDGLENREVEKGVKGSSREGSAGQDVEATMAELPSSYAEVILNDNLTFKTRVKQYSNMPFFNAGTEIFVRDWTKSELRVVIRDARVREHDPIMGIVSLPLRNLFKDASQVEQMFSIQDGVGYGKVALSLLFKAVKLEIPRELRGFNTVHVDILSNIELDIPDKEWNSKLQGLKVTIIAGLNEFKMKALKRHPECSEDDPLITIPVYERYSTLLVFEFGRNPIPGLNKPSAISVLPLCELEDDQTTEVVLPVVHADNAKQLERNYIDAQCKDTHKFEEVGTISMRVRVNPGLSEDFRPYATGARDRHEFEVYERLVGLPWRAEQNSHANDDGVITRHEKKDIKQLQTEQLHMRHRGAMGYTPVRTAKWAKDGLKDHVKQIGSKILGKEKRDQSIFSET
ncbi:hypothetical protein MYAM1_002343 [Malassezia yamatoensis]|uniref:Uncharacterized protein n=1 Tax=Malassezia yamatoensis TaxID=253288 RepID=A0AAJ6CI85_9BASI|nr:hypothetical protein MYAM1_002343 [Malassezia yamatoensis]